MICIGIRATPNEIFYAVIKVTNGSNIKIEVCSKVNIPVSFILPEKLNFIRKTFKDIIFEFKAQNAGIRITESNAQQINIDRVSYESVIQELFSNSTIKKYFIAQISNITSKLGIPRDSYKKHVSNELSYELVEKWEEYNVNEREAILTAIASSKI